MAEKIVSPGVFTNEIDQTFLPAAVAEIGACLIGPTVKGPAMTPTKVSSYSEFQQVFGDTLKSGSTPVQFLTSHTAQQYLRNSDTLLVMRILEGSFSEASASVFTGSAAALANSAADKDTGLSFTLSTRAVGSLQNNSDTTSRTNNLLISGSTHSIRYEISNINEKKGTFTVLVRRGDDTHNRKQILETFTGVDLDPNSNNYIGKVIGDQVQTIRFDENSKPFLQLSGSFPQKSKYIKVSDINDTPDYIDNNGNVRDGNLSASLPQSGSGSFNGGFIGGSDGYLGFDALGNPNVGTDGTPTGSQIAFYENISETNSHGFDLTSDNRGKSAYEEALDLLSNQDEYDFNLILAPGVISAVHSSIAAKIVTTCEDRGDAFAILDPVVYGKNVGDATSAADERDSNYAAMYWPWVKVPDGLIAGTQRWVPPSVVLGGIYAFNDKVAHPWFAPAGLNRGGIDAAIQAERKLTQSDRDTLYDSNVNPIATFPGQGVTVFGQKTLQKKASALDRVNVRRLLIKVKKFIASSSRFLVFEQNTAATRRRFLGIANPFLEQVQSQSGLNAFRVVMDETNNTPDTIDRNQLIGQLFLQPTRTAEFIVLDFTVQPTGASFPE